MSDELRRAFDVVDRDSGGHLIGTVYPSVPGHDERFDVPPAWQHLCAPAEAALRRLRETSAADWEDFLVGEWSVQNAIRRRQGDLEEAHLLVQGFFDGWPENEEKSC